MILQTSMDMFTQMIANVGFPIAAFVMMYRLATSTIRENTQALQELKLQLEGMNK
jgi:hypothetical protein